MAEPSPDGNPVRGKPLVVAPVWIALGSNVGDRAGLLSAAVEEMGAFLEVTALSELYETSPMYVEDQPPYLNAALIAASELGPFGLLRKLKGLESQLGRETRSRFGPREVDLDLLAYGAMAYRSSSLELPHPRIRERKFVLLPLHDVTEDVTGVGSIPEAIQAIEASGLAESDTVDLFKDERWDRLRQRMPSSFTSKPL